MQTQGSGGEGQGGQVVREAVTCRDPGCHTGQAEGRHQQACSLSIQASLERPQGDTQLRGGPGRKEEGILQGSLVPMGMSCFQAASSSPLEAALKTRGHVPMCGVSSTDGSGDVGGQV